MKKQYFVIITFALIALLITLLVLNPNLTGSAVKDKYSYTKAVCSGSGCQDYEVVCENSIATSINPVSGKVTFSQDWQDTRSEEDKNRLCN